MYNEIFPFCRVGAEEFQYGGRMKPLLDPSFPVRPPRPFRESWLICFILATVTKRCIVRQFMIWIQLFMLKKQVDYVFFNNFLDFKSTYIQTRNDRDVVNLIF